MPSSLSLSLSLAREANYGRYGSRTSLSRAVVWSRVRDQRASVADVPVFLQFRRIPRWRERGLSRSRARTRTPARKRARVSGTRPRVLPLRAINKSVLGCERETREEKPVERFPAKGSAICAAYLLSRSVPTRPSRRPEQLSSRTQPRGAG